MQIILEILIIILAVDFASGLLHWLEDSYGHPDWPITGKWITRPNMLHHKNPNAFTANSWLQSATVLLVIGAAALGVAWAVGALGWQLLLVVAIGVNANEIHKWSHLPRGKKGFLVTWLQDARLLQSARHHGRHHSGSKDSHYCLITNVVNPVLEIMKFWRGLEWLIELLFGVRKRPEPRNQRAAKALELSENGTGA